MIFSISSGIKYDDYSEDMRRCLYPARKEPISKMGMKKLLKGHGMIWYFHLAMVWNNGFKNISEVIGKSS